MSSQSPLDSLALLLDLQEKGCSAQDARKIFFEKNLKKEDCEVENELKKLGSEADDNETGDGEEEEEDEEEEEGEFDHTIRVFFAHFSLLISGEFRALFFKFSLMNFALLIFFMAFFPFNGSYVTRYVATLISLSTFVMSTLILVAQFRVSRGQPLPLLPFDHRAFLLTRLLVYIGSFFVSLLPEWETHYFLRPPRVVGGEGQRIGVPEGQRVGVPAAPVEEGSVGVPSPLPLPEEGRELLQGNETKEGETPLQPCKPEERKTPLDAHEAEKEETTPLEKHHPASGEGSDRGEN